MPILEIKENNEDIPFYTCWLVLHPDSYCLSCFTSGERAKKWGDLFFEKMKEKRNTVNKKITFSSKYMEDILREMPPDDEDIE